MGLKFTVETLVQRAQVQSLSLPINLMLQYISLLFYFKFVLLTIK